MLENPFYFAEDRDMTIREATANVVAYLRSNKTLTRMLAAFVVGVVAGALLF